MEEIAGAVVRVVDTVEPEPELAARYEARYRQFQQIYPACRPLFQLRGVHGHADKSSPGQGVIVRGSLPHEIGKEKHMVLPQLLYGRLLELAGAGEACPLSGTRKEREKENNGSCQQT